MWGQESDAHTLRNVLMFADCAEVFWESQARHTPAGGAGGWGWEECFLKVMGAPAINHPAKKSS